MAIINVLSPHVADMIAAGEVVERPASVIKELMENSLDAGANNLTVEIRGGGATYIRVSDDGCGMQPEDAGVAFLRHATSKLHDERGLEAIHTMGFRGEALAAISAVSHIELRTRVRGAAEGTLVTLDAGDIQDMGPCGCPEGTSMIVRELFYNTPARLKFLKSDRSEASACVQTALKIALGHPEVSIRMIRDGQEEFFSPGDGKMSSCIYTLLGRDTASSFLELNSTADGLSVTGYVSSPAAGRGSRATQFFFCNGRYIKSPLIQSAVEQAYKNTLLTGRFPACVLYLNMSCGSVDVNVHPAKTEVKFSQERRVFDLVYQAVRLALEREDATAKIELSPGTMKLAGLSGKGGGTYPDTPHPAQPAANIGAPRTNPAARPAARDNFYQSMSAEEFRAKGYSAAKGGKSAPGRDAAVSPARVGLGASFAPARDTALQRAEKGAESPRPAGFSAAVDVTTESPAYVPASSPAKSEAEALFQPDFFTARENSVENNVQNVEKPAAPDHKIVGEALKTYIIVERGEELIFIDKHAAHERMIFDRLKAQKREIMAQQLLVPVTLRLSGEDAELIEQNGETLLELGFELEPYGERAYVLRAVPCDIDPADAAAAVEELCSKLASGKSLDPAAARDELLHTVACKAAIKAGWDTDPRELERLVEAVLSGAVKYCPHGRPVSFVMTRKELDKQCKRIV